MSGADDSGLGMTTAIDRQALLVRGGWLLFFGGGLIASMLVYGLLQERVMTISYEGEMFGFSSFLVFMNRFWSVIFAVVMIPFHKETFRHQATWWKYLIISFSNVFATTCQYEALKYISFVWQMLGKSFKMMPVMLWGIAISGKKYGWREWMVAFAVTVGVTEFICVDPQGSSNGASTNIKGLLLIVGYLALDGLTSTMQEKLFKEENCTKYNQMMYVNACSALVSIVMLLAEGSLPACVAFCGAHPRFLLDAFILSVSAVAGQFFIYSQIREFGAVVFAATMNVRQLASIILSYVMYGHYITWLMMLGIAIVFTALGYKSYIALFPPDAKKTGKGNSETDSLKTNEKTAVGKV